MHAMARKEREQSKHQPDHPLPSSFCVLFHSEDDLLRDRHTVWPELVFIYRARKGLGFMLWTHGVVVRKNRLGWHLDLSAHHQSIDARWEGFV